MNLLPGHAEVSARKLITYTGLIGRQTSGGKTCYQWSKPDTFQNWVNNANDTRMLAAYRQIDPPPFTYNFNTLGHRTDLEIDELKDKGYVLVVGCSHSEGEGIPSQSRYGELIAKELGLQCYCLGLGGIANDAIHYQVNQWFKVVAQRPKLVIVQWTYSPRYTLWPQQLGPSTQVRRIETVGPWRKDLMDAHPDIATLLTSGTTLYYWQALKVMTQHCVGQWLDTMGVANWHFDTSLEPQEHKFTGKVITCSAIDLARDLQHPGEQSQRQWANQLLTEFYK